MTRSIECEPKNAAFRHNLGLVYATGGKLQEARLLSRAVSSSLATPLPGTTSETYSRCWDAVMRR